MTVSREDLAAALDELAASVVRPEHGLTGPGSWSWRIDRESVLFLGGGRAALLQLAHPFVAHAVDQHSATRSDPLGRFQRTFDNVYAMVFGELGQALRSARRVHAIHTRIHGTIDEDVGAFRRGDRYDANDEGGLLWVHATLIDSALLVYESVFGPLRPVEREAYYQETKRFALLFGLRDRHVPRDSRAFDDYMRDMLASDTIAVGRPARELGEFLFQAPSRAAQPPLRWLKSMTAGLMPERLRAPFGLRFESAERRVFRASMASLRRVYPRIPERLRVVPAYSHALRRVSGRGDTDPIARFVEARLPVLASVAGFTRRAER
ncbi:MAG: DUF2236 domain-containing protein [Polyangiaceae bacterium]|nr:DUF2236 domain-containing protein [Polyangiaceae bacterium]